MENKYCLGLILKDNELDDVLEEIHNGKGITIRIINNDFLKVIDIAIGKVKKSNKYINIKTTINEFEKLSVMIKNKYEYIEFQDSYRKLRYKIC